MPRKPPKKPNKPIVKRTLDSEIKTVTTVPIGYITARAFADKVATSPSSITQAKNLGKFAPSNMRFVKLPGKKPHLYYHWESEGPAYIRNRKRELWPEWFQQEEALRETATTGEHEAGPGGEPTGSGIQTQSKVFAVENIHDAKLRGEILKIERQELELQKAKNEVLDLEEVAGLLQEVGQGTSQGVLAVCPRLAPLLAAESDSHKCLQILEQELTQVLESLSTLDDFVAKKQAAR